MPTEMFGKNKIHQLKNFYFEFIEVLFKTTKAHDIHFNGLDVSQFLRCI